MKQPILKRNEQGFTIIEVLIVLAIAGLILVIVFLAVPALQRNSRNTQRTNDAARTASAVNECLANNNGKIGNCDDFTAGTEIGNYVTIADNQQLIAVGGPSTDAFTFAYATKCDAAGTASVAGSGRSFTITFQVETTGTPAGRCVGS